MTTPERISDYTLAAFVIITVLFAPVVGWWALLAGVGVVVLQGIIERSKK